MVQRLKKSVVRQHLAPKSKELKPIIKHIFHVTDILLWKVVIFRYVLVRETAKSVVVLNSTHQEKTHRKQSDQGGWFHDIKDARKFAREQMAIREEKIDRIVKQFQDAKTEIDANRIRVVTPQKIKPTDLKNIKF